MITKEQIANIVELAKKSQAVKKVIKKVAIEKMTFTDAKNLILDLYNLSANNIEASGVSIMIMNCNDSILKRIHSVIDKYK